MQAYGCLYEKGHRASNQDSIALHKMITRYGEAVLAVVCDGMGGMEEGETASGYVAEEMSCWFYKELPGLLEKRAGKRRIGRALFRKLFNLHLQLKQYGKEKKIQTGTTVSILFVTERWYLVCHVGDSAVYRLQGDKIKRLTKIHGDAVSTLERCIGLGKYDSPDLIFGRVKKNMGFLLSSDGFYHRLNVKEISDAFADRPLASAERIEKRLAALAAKASQRGETDNISAIYLE